MGYDELKLALLIVIIICLVYVMIILQDHSRLIDGLFGWTRHYSSLCLS